MPMNIISLGAGVQSSTMALMAARGQIPVPDCAIFADTQAEPKAVYEWLYFLEKQLPFPVHRVTRGDLWKSASTVRRTRDGERTYLSTGIPVYTVDGLKKGIGKRQCTRTFKIEPVIKKCRELLCMGRIPQKSGILVHMWMGISTDEAHRMKPAAMPWIKATWPLIDAGLSRADCLNWCERHGYPRPPRSACTFCPFHDDASWLALSKDEFSDATEKERQLQDAYAKASALHSVPFFHDSRVPLGEVHLIAEREYEQLSMFGNECEGMCGV